MTKNELIAKLIELINLNDDNPESNHYAADRLLLKFINDPDVTTTFDRIDKWYS